MNASRTPKRATSISKAGSAASIAWAVIFRSDVNKPTGVTMANPFVHCELATSDVGKAKGFYGKLFDWKFDDMPMEGGTYSLIGVGEGTGGGLMKNPMPDAPSMWMPYVQVSDIKAATTKARSLG